MNGERMATIVAATKWSAYRKLMNRICPFVSSYLATFETKKRNQKQKLTEMRHAFHINIADCPIHAVINSINGITFPIPIISIAVFAQIEHQHVNKY